jgi:uncharacterized protein (DUF488 family)
MPWFSQEPLAAALREAGIEYIHLPELGGRRNPRHDSPNGGWRVGQFQGYADHMASAEFAAGMERLEATARRRRTAVMCAEAAWKVLHLDARGAAQPHVLTEFAVVEGEAVSYPPAQAALDL